MLDYNFSIELQILYSIVILCLILCLIPMKREIKAIIISLYIFLWSKTFLTYFEILKAYATLRSRKNHNFFREKYVSLIFRYLTVDANFEHLPKENSLFLVNYPDQRLEYMLQGFFPRDLCLVASDRIKNFVSLIYPKEQLILLPDGGKNFDKTKNIIKEKIQHYNIFVYINDNKTRISEYHCGKMRKGMFYIAKELGIPITPIAISHIEPICGSIIKNQTIYIRVGSTTIVTNPIQSMIDTRSFLQQNLSRFRELLKK